jgi:hypothetical protein
MAALLRSLQPTPDSDVKLSDKELTVKNKTKL